MPAARDAWAGFLSRGRTRANRRVDFSAWHRGRARYACWVLLLSHVPALARRMAEGDQLELRLVIKADVQGSVEAVADALAKLSTDKVRVAIIHAGVGGITEGDVNLAIASKAILVGFAVRPAGKSSALAEEKAVRKQRTFVGIIGMRVDPRTRAATQKGSDRRLSMKPPSGSTS